MLRGERRNNGGFTLMEVIISVFIMSLIVMIVYPTFTSIMESNKIMEQSGVRQTREAQALMSMIKSELGSAFLSKRAGEDKFIIRNNDDYEGNARDEVYFTSFASSMLDDSAVFSDQAEIGYYLKEDDEKRVLYKRESSLIDEDITEGGSEIRLIDSVEYFGVAPFIEAFSDEDAMSTEASEGDNKKFPQGGVLVSIGLKGDDGKVYNYESAIEMPNYVVSESPTGGEAGGEVTGGQDLGSGGQDTGNGGENGSEN